MEQMFPLAQALEKFSDPEILSRYDKIERICKKRNWVGRRFGETAIIWPAPRDYSKLAAVYESAKQALTDPFLDKLRSGALVAVGTPYPATPNSPEIAITPAQWHFLKPLFTTDDSVADGGGLRLVGVRVGLADAQCSELENDWSKPQVSQAPRPITPLRGGLGARAIAAVNQSPDWEKWGDRLTVRLWQAVALWMEIEPETLSGHGISASFRDCPAEFKQLLDIACDHAEHGSLHCSLLANSIPYSTVALSDFADWHSALSVKLPLPKNFPRKLKAPAPSETEVAASDAVNQLRPAPRSKVDEAISAVYDEAAAFREKPPNVNELVAPARLKLQKQGLSASKALIQKIAGDPKHASRRGPIGVTQKNKKV